jgi:hypothetical protein
LANFVSIADGHENVSKNEVRAYIGNFSYRRFTVANSNDVDALIFQGKAHHLLDVAVIVGNENPGH